MIVISNTVYKHSIKDLLWIARGSQSFCAACHGSVVMWGGVFFYFSMRHALCAVL
jgi:hypothetical protein